MKNQPRFSRTLCVLVVGVFTLSAVASVRAGTTTNATWTGGGGGSTGWNTTANWSGGNQPQGGSTTTLIHFAGGTSLSPNCDYGSFTQEGEILFDSGASAFTLGGAAVKLAIGIENDSLNIQTYSQSGLSLSGATTFFNASTGDLVINNSVFLDGGGSAELDMQGAHNITISGVIGNGGGSTGKVVLQGTGTTIYGAANTYTGGTFINSGTLQINSGGSVTTGAGLDVGNTTGSSNGTLSIGTATSVSNNILIRSGSTGTKTLSGLSTSATQTFSGVIAIATGTGAGLSASGAGSTGILDFSNQVLSGTPGTLVTLTATGGTVQLSGTADNTDLGVDVQNGATLNLNKSAAGGTHAFGNNSTVELGGKMVITGSSGDQIFDNASLTVNGTFDLNSHSETINALNGSGTVTNGGASSTSTLTTGGNAGGGTFSGVLQDGGSGKILALTKIGAGTLTLSGPDTYTGLTTISVGTINIQNNTALGSTSTGTSITSGAALELQGGITVGAEALALNGAGPVGGALRNVSGNNTYGGLITLGSASTITSVTAGANVLTLSGGLALGANRITVNGAGDTTVMTTGITGTNGGDILKQGTGTLNLNVASTFVGSGTGNANAAFIDQGTISVGATGALGTTDGATTGLVSMGSSGTGGLNTALNISSSGVTLANPVLIRYLQTGGKTLSGTFTSGSSTYSGAISLADHLSIVAANGGTLLFTGVISQAAGTGSATPGVGLVNNTSPTGGFSTNGPGVIINSGASSTGIVEYDNAMSYVGDTVVNSGTLQFNGSGSLLSSTIRLGALGPATLNLISPTGSTLNVTVNVRTANSIISASNTSGTSTLGGHFALDANATVQEASSTGTLAITQAHNLANTTTGTDIKGFTLTLTPTGTISISGDIYNSTGSGNILMNGSGLLVFSGATANTYTGTTTVSSGELDLSKTNGINAIGGNVLINGGTLKWMADNQVADSAMITLSSGTLSLNGHSETVVDLTNTGGTFTTGSGADLAHPATWTGTGSSMTWAGGTNTVNTFGAVLENHLTITAGTNEVQAGGLVQLSLTGLTMNGGTVTLDADPTTPGKLALMSNVTATDGTTSNILSSSPTNPGVVDLMGATRTFAIGTTNAATTLNISASITSSGGNILKTGAGALVLTGNNTFTGTTTVSGGTLNAGAAGALGATSSVTVNSGGTLLLSGSGNLNRINDSAGIALGTTSGAAGILARSGTASEGTGAHTTNGGISSTGTNAVGLGALTLNSNSTLDFGTGGVGTLVFASFTPNSHVLNIINYMTTASAPLVSGTDGTDDRLIFHQDQGPLGNNDLADFSFGGISATEIALGGGFFEIVPIPEPGTWVAGSLVFASLLLTQRKRLTRLVRRPRLACRAEALCEGGTSTS